VTISQEGLRLSDYCVGIFEELPSRKSVKKAISKGRILVNGHPGQTGTWVTKGMFLQLQDHLEKERPVFRLDLKIIYEDEYMAVLIKPPGIPVSGNQFRTVNNALPGVLSPSREADRLSYPRAVHRLDSPTSGILLVAKTGRANIALGQQFAGGTIQKTYQAIVCGFPKEHGFIDEPIQGKAASTSYRVLQRERSLKNDFLSLLELSPKTGRTHQLRIHLSNLGHPIMGDALYGESGKIYKGKGLFLAATGIEFQHPIHKKPMFFESKAPSKFELLLSREAQMWTRFQQSQK